MEECEQTCSLVDLIKEDPIKGARRCRAAIKRDDESFQAQRRRRMAEGSLVAAELKADYGRWCEFISDEFFDQYKRIRKKDEQYFEPIVMRSVMLYIFDVSSTNKSMCNRVWRYARAMEAYADQEVPNEELVDRIKTDGGIEKACRAACKEYSREREEDDWVKQMNARPEEASNPLEPEEGSDYEDEEIDAEEWDEAYDESIADKDAVILRVEVTPEELNELLTDQTDQYRFLIRRGGRDLKLGGTRFIAIHIDPLE
jgi:hypothetical protein